MQPDGPGAAAVVADKEGLPQRRDAGGARRDRRSESRIGAGARSALLETPPEKRAVPQELLCANRRCVRGRRGRRLQHRRRELVERSFAHLYETGGIRRVRVRGRESVRKRVLIQAVACNFGLLLRRQTGVGTPQSLQGRASCGDVRADRALDPRLGAPQARLGAPTIRGSV